MKMLPRIQETQGQETDAKRVKSQIGFPYGDLDDAIGVVKKIFEKKGQQYCGIDQLAAWLGHESMTSGAFRLKLTTARTFGLIEFDHDSVKLTRLGCDIVEEGLERQAKADAFLTVPLYKKLFENYRGRTLPPDIGLEQEMAELGVPPKQKDKARQAFQRSAQQAGFFEQGRTKLVLPSGLGPQGTNSVPRNTRPLDTSQAPPPTIPTLQQYHYGGGSGGGSNGMQAIQEQPLIQGLFQALPPVGAQWSQAKRKAWLILAENIFNMLYTDEGQGYVDK